MNGSLRIDSRCRGSLGVVFGLWVFLWIPHPELGAAPPETTPLERLAAAIPQAPNQYGPQTTEKLWRLAAEVEQWAVELTYYSPDASDDEIIEAVDHLITIHHQVDKLVEQIIDQKGYFLTPTPHDAKRESLRSFLASITALNNLSGRLRYLSVDVLTDAGYDLINNIDGYEQLINLFIAKKSSVGATAALDLLLERSSDESLTPLSNRVKGKIIQLIRITRDTQTQGLLAELVRQKNIDPELLILVADTIRHIGMPQDPRPEHDPDLQAPAITANELYAIVANVNTADLSLSSINRHNELLSWLDQRNKFGVTGDTYRMGRAGIKAGDWLLMKNPSPYNRFTDLYPGLFTHAGVVTTETGSDGRRRFVIVDLPETGSSIPATTVDTFVKRTLDYVFIRHKDLDVARTMARVARTVIGNESKFDLNFRTAGIEQLKGQHLDNKIIDGYCAGLLLLCAQETGKPRAEFFPVPEHPAPGETTANLAKLDVSMPNDFLSPTGPFFSPQMDIVFRCPTMYSPRREIEQTIYDHFAKRMRDNHLTPSLDWYQSLRIQMAKATQGNPALSGALANVAGVNPNMDLVAAAKLGAVVQTLDTIAQNASTDYREARAAFRLDTIDQLRNEQAAESEIDKALNYRRRHADLFVRWEADTITPRQLRVELMNHYIARGHRQLDDHFFKSSNNDGGHPVAVDPEQTP